jgi:hypothetical protein
MKRLIRVGLLATALGTLLAALAGTSASATVICRVGTDGDAMLPNVQCPDMSEHVGSLAGALKASNATFVSTFGTITCNLGPLNSQVVDSGGASPGNGGDGIPNGSITAVDWEHWIDADADDVIDPEEVNPNCPSSILLAPTASFAAIDTNGAGAGLWDATARWQSDNTASSPNGTLTLLNVRVAVTVNFRTPLVCQYVGDEDGSGSGSDTNVVGDVYNPNNGDKVVFRDVPLRITESSGTCPSTSRFSGTYFVRITAETAPYLREDDA